MKINALLCHNCKNIIYSKSRNHFNSCDCGNISVDGGFDYFKISHKDNAKFTTLQLNSNVLLEQILQYDYLYGNRNIPEQFINGWHGKFRLSENSNKVFYKKLIKNYKEVEILVDELKYIELHKENKLAKKKGLMK